MKYMNKIIAIIAILSISFYGITYSGDLGVDEIKVIDTTTLSVTLSENPNLEVGEIEGEITILSDVKLRGGFISEDNSLQAELILETALMPNTTYSLLTVSGAEGSIDFITPQDVEGYSVSNIASSDTQDIDTIEVINDRTITIMYREELTSSILEYKLLAESQVAKIEKPDYFLPELIITVEPPFVGEQDYILMFIDMQDVEGTYLEFDTGIYDFTTPMLDTPETTEVIVISEMIDDSEVVGEDVSADNETLEESEIDLLAAGDSLEKDGNSEIDVTNLVNVVTETPDTGAQTWVLILLTLVINSFYYLSRKKAKLLTA